MVIIVNGPLGIGKSTVSWELLYRFPRAVMLDVDHVAAFHPFDFYEQAHLDYSYETLRVLVEHHVRHSFEDFVVNWVLESAEQLARLTASVAGAGGPVHAFRLRCEPEVVAARVRARSRPDLEWELARARELAGILDRAAGEGDLGTVIDTTALTPAETAERIWALINE
jgi:broad-specificity NMP kinase